MLEGQHKRQELQERLGLSDRKHFNQDRSQIRRGICLVDTSPNG
ncbi:MAG: hypothetical protein ACLFM1_01820 [Bacteroidales bacterium]